MNSSFHERQLEDACSIRLVWLANRRAESRNNMDGARVLRHVGDLRYADWTMSLRTPRSANSILACTLKRRQPHLKAPFNNIAKFFQITPTFREGQLIYEESLEKEESGSWMEYRGLPEFITASHNKIHHLFVVER